jgi:hypothetical protein
MADLNRQFVLKSRPEGTRGLDNFELTKAAVPEPGNGELLMRTLYLSLDPYMRGRMSAAKYLRRRKATAAISLVACLGRSYRPCVFATSPPLRLFAADPPTARIVESASKAAWPIRPIAVGLPASMIPSG